MQNRNMMHRAEITVDKRATLQLRIWLNKFLGNKCSVNTQLAQTITEYSHATCVKKSAMFTNVVPSHFLCVTEVQSPFWCKVVQMEARMAINNFRSDLGFGRIFYEPDWSHVSKSFRKRIFEPYGQRPFIKNRDTRYYLVK